MKELLDVQKFDMVVITWFKQQWRYPKMDKMVITDRETLIKLAWWAYDPAMTVTKAKWLRIWDIKRELLEEVEEEENNEKENLPITEDSDSTGEVIETQENNQVEENYDVDTEELDEETENSPLIKGDGQRPEEFERITQFDIPNTTWEMNKLKEILNKFPWEVKVKIWLIEKWVSEEWLQELQNLLIKN